MGVLVILTPGFPKDEKDSSCLPAVQKFVLAAQKITTNHRLHVITFQYPFQEKNYSWNDIQIDSIGGKNKSKLKRLITWHKAYHKLKQLKKKETIVGVLSLWLGECALIGQVFSKRNHIRHFIWMHGQDAKSDNRYVHRVNAKQEALIAISHFIQEEFHKNYKIKPFLIVENGILESDFPKLNSGNRVIDIIGVGSLTKLKNFCLFIDCVLKLKTSFHTLNVVIVGEGEEFETLQLQIQTHGLQNNIRLLGAQTHSQTLNLLNQSKLFLHTSFYEGNSSALIEALYSGCKVISTCALRPESIPNFIHCTTKQKIIQCLDHLLESNYPTERVLFNNMEESAKKILALYN